MLTTIHQTSLKMATVPSEWREALLTTLYKKGTRNIHASYRPVWHISFKQEGSTIEQLGASNVMSSTGNCPWSPFILVYINDFPAVYRFADDTLQFLLLCYWICIGYLMYIVKYSDLVHMARMHQLASASPPYKRVPHIL